MKQVLAVFLLLAGSIVSYGQASYATVTGTVTDPNGNPYAFARLSATLVSSTGVPLKYVYFADGSRYVVPPVNATLGSDGAFSVSVLKNTSATSPAGTQWQFNISDPANPGIVLTYAPSWSITYSAAISADVSFTTPLSTRALAVYFTNLQSGQNTVPPPLVPLVLPNGSTATTQAANDNSAKVATTAYAQNPGPAILTTTSEHSLGTCTTAATVSAANGNRQKVTLTNAQACALSFTQPVSGTFSITLKITQSAAGSFNGTISGCLWPGGLVPTITATSGAVDFVSVYLDGAAAYCTASQDFK